MGESVGGGGVFLCSGPLAVGMSFFQKEGQHDTAQGRAFVSVLSKAGKRELTLPATLGDCTLPCLQL